MRKSRFTEFQIVKILKSVEGGRTVVDVYREHGVSNATYYKWKSKYGDMKEAAHRYMFAPKKFRPSPQTRLTWFQFSGS